MRAGLGENLKIRAHHLLCMFGFRGLGYSAAFIENMRSVVDSFFSQSGVEVELAAGRDVICAACPHMADGKCAAEEGADHAVRSRDREVLRRLGLAPGDRLSSSSLARLVADRIDPSALPDICAGCRWLAAGYCQEGLRNFRKERQRHQQGCTG